MGVVMHVLDGETDQKWCPMVRNDNGDNSEPFTGGTQSMWERAPKWARCIGSSCMMWRWRLEDNDSDEGFCGLAGIPAADI